METCGTCGAEVPSHNMHLHQVRVSPFHIETCDRRSPCRRTANETLPNASFVATRFLGIIHQLRVGYCFDLRALRCCDASAIMKICVRAGSDELEAHMVERASSEALFEVTPNAQTLLPNFEFYQLLMLSCID